MTRDVWMRADLIGETWAVTLWKCRAGQRPAVEAHRVACRLDDQACWQLLEDLQDLWKPRGITVRWAGRHDAGQVNVPRWRRDLERLETDLSARALREECLVNEAVDQRR